MIQIILMTIPILVVFAAPALAEVTANPVGDALANLLVNDVFPILGVFLVGLVGVVLNKLRQRLNLQISEATQSKFESLAYQGVTYAEEKAAQAVKSGVTKLTGQEKLDIAIAHIIEAAPKISQEQADKLVHSMLARLAGTGSTGDKAAQ